MGSQSVSSSTIKLNLPAGILRNAQNEAKRIGISLQDFIRMLMANYFAGFGPVKTVSRDQALYERALGEINRGEYTKISSKKEFDEFFRKLDN